MDIETLRRLALVTLANRGFKYRKHVTLELLKAVISKPDVDLSNTEGIMEVVRDLREAFYEEIDSKMANDGMYDSEFELECRFDFERHYGFKDEDEFTNTIATIIDAWGGVGASMTTNTIATPTNPRTT